MKFTYIPAILAALASTITAAPTATPSQVYKSTGFDAAKWVGYHGTCNEAFAKSISEGIKVMPKKPGQKKNLLGDGFYMTPAVDQAFNFAKSVDPAVCTDDTIYICEIRVAGGMESVKPTKLILNRDKYKPGKLKSAIEIKKSPENFDGYVKFLGIKDKPVTMLGSGAQLVFPPTSSTLSQLKAKCVKGTDVKADITAAMAGKPITGVISLNTKMYLNEKQSWGFVADTTLKPDCTPGKDNACVVM